MWTKLGEWIAKSYVRGFRRYKVHINLDRANIKRLKAMLYEEKSFNRVLDLTVDVWGSAGPDCRTQPVKAG